jgi:hypothetical protein
VGTRTMLSPLSRSMVIGDLNAGRPGLCPGEADAELVVDPNTELSGSVALQGPKAIARWEPEGGQTHRGIQLVELAPGDCPKARWACTPGGLSVAAVKDVLRASVAEGDYHRRRGVPVMSGI